MQLRAIADFIVKELPQPIPHLIHRVAKISNALCLNQLAVSREFDDEIKVIVIPEPAPFLFDLPSYLTQDVLMICASALLQRC